MAYSLIDLGFPIANSGLTVESSLIEQAVALSNITDWWTAESAYLDLSGDQIIRWKPLKVGGVRTLEQATISKRATLTPNRIVDNPTAVFDATTQDYYSVSAAVDMSASFGLGMFYKPTRDATVEGLAFALSSSTSRFGVNKTSTGGGLQASCGASGGGGVIGGTCTIGAWNSLRLFKDNPDPTTRRLRLRSNGVESTPVPHDNGTSSVPIIIGAIQSGNSHASMEVSDFFLINADFDTAGFATMNAFSTQAYGIPF
jgi:hypothetical protein